MPKKINGFALLQALFFMMFIMAIVSIAMMMSGQRAVNAEGERMATDAYPAISAFAEYAQQNLTTTASEVYGPDYFDNNPLYNKYIEDSLKANGFSDPTKCDGTEVCTSSNRANANLSIKMT